MAEPGTLSERAVWLVGAPCMDTLYIRVKGGFSRLQGCGGKLGGFFVCFFAMGC